MPRHLGTAVAAISTRPVAMHALSLALTCALAGQLSACTSAEEPLDAPDVAVQAQALTCAPREQLDTFENNQEGWVRTKPTCTGDGAFFVSRPLTGPNPPALRMRAQCDNAPGWIELKKRYDVSELSQCGGLDARLDFDWRCAATSASRNECQLSLYVDGLYKKWWPLHYRAQADTGWQHFSADISRYLEDATSTVELRFRIRDSWSGQSDARIWLDNVNIHYPEHHEAFVWANRPTTTAYTPSTSYAYNSTGRPIKVRRVGTGSYTVVFDGIRTLRGNLQVSAYGSASTRCKSTGIVAGEETTFQVSCHGSDGALRDSRFVAFYSTGSSEAPEGYVRTTSAGSSHTPDRHFSFNSAYRENQVIRTGVGAYNVAFEGLSASGGNAQVTAMGLDDTHCAIERWYPSGADVNVLVRCHDSDGYAADSLFSLRYFTQGLGRGLEVGHAWVHDALASSTPSETPGGYQHNTMDTADPTVVVRTGTGRYRVIFDALDAVNATPLVSRYGSSGVAYCHPSGWYASGGATGMNVVCFDSDGAPTDASFTVALAATQPSRYRVVAMGGVSQNVPAAVKTVTDGSLTMGDPLSEATLTTYQRYASSGGTTPDLWYVKDNGDVFKVLIGGAGVPIGLLYVEQDGRLSVVLDIDGNRSVDLVSSYHSDGSALLATNTVGEASFRDDWDAGNNPFCKLGGGHLGGALGGADRRASILLCDRELDNFQDAWMARRLEDGSTAISSAFSFNPVATGCDLLARGSWGDPLEDSAKEWAARAVANFVTNDPLTGEESSVAAMVIKTVLGAPLFAAAVLHAYAVDELANGPFSIWEGDEPFSVDDYVGNPLTPLPPGGPGGSDEGDAEPVTDPDSCPPTQSECGGGSYPDENDDGLTEEQMGEVCSLREHEGVTPWFEEQWLGGQGIDAGDRCNPGAVAGLSGLLGSALTGDDVLDALNGFCQVSQPLPFDTAGGTVGDFADAALAQPYGECSDRVADCDPDRAYALQLTARSQGAFMGLDICPMEVCNPLPFEP